MPNKDLRDIQNLKKILGGKTRVKLSLVFEAGSIDSVYVLKMNAYENPTNIDKKN